VTRVTRCPICNETQSPRGLAIHVGMKHGIHNQRRRCRYAGENRGWCFVHDAEWRIDRSRCEAPINIAEKLAKEPS